MIGSADVPGGRIFGIQKYRLVQGVWPQAGDASISQGVDTTPDQVGSQFWIARLCSQGKSDFQLGIGSEGRLDLLDQVRPLI